MAKELKVTLRADGSQLTNEMTRAAASVAQLERQSKAAERELLNMSTSAKTLDDIDRKFRRLTDSTLPLKSKLRSLQNLMAEMNLNGLEKTNLFSEMAQQAGTYSDAMGDARTAVSAFANDNMKIQAATEGLQLMCGVASTASGVMALLGTENENLVRTIMKLQATMNVLNGVQTVANMLNKDSTLMLRLKQLQQIGATAATAAATAATTANTAVTGANVAIMKAWNVTKAVSKALLGDFTGLLIVGGVALGAYAIATRDSTKETKKQDEALQSASNAMTQYNANVATNAANLIGKFQALRIQWNMLKTDAERTEWIKNNQTELRNLGLCVDDLVSAENVFVNNTDKVIESLDARAKAMAAQAMLVEAYKKEFERKFAADNSVVGGGYRNQYKFDGKDKWSTMPQITDQMQKAGVTLDKDFEMKLNDRGVYEYKPKVDQINKKVNDYLAKTARATNKAIHESAEAETNKVVAFATKEIEEAENTIKSLGLLSDNTPSPTNNNGGGKNTPPPLTDIEKNEKAFNEYKKSVDTAIDRFNKGLITKDQLNDIVKTANEYFKNNNLKANIELEYETDANGYELAKILKKEKPKTEIEIKRDQLEAVRKDYQQLKSDFDNGLIDEKTFKDGVAKINELLKSLGVDPIKLPTELEIKRKQFDELQSRISQLGSDYNNKLIDKDTLEKEVEEINKLLQSLGADPIVIRFETNGVELLTELQDKLKQYQEQLEQTKKQQEQLQSAYNAMSSVIGSVGQSFANLGNTMQDAGSKAALSVAGTIAQAIATMVSGYATATSQASSMGPWAWIAFAATGLAALTAAIAGIHQATSGIAGYAQGGIIGGATTVGDYNIARVNAGEMILNHRQQGKLFNILNGNGFYNQQSNGGTVTVRMHGKELVGVMKNYNSQISKVL